MSKTAKRETDSDSVLGTEELPLFTHTYVLGVDIGVPHKAHQEAIRTDGEIETNLSMSIESWQGDKPNSRVERDVSAWARRNLFDGRGGSSSVNHDTSTENTAAEGEDQ